MSDRVFTIAITGLPAKPLSVSPFCNVLVSLGVIGRSSVC